MDWIFEYSNHKRVQEYLLGVPCLSSVWDMKSVLVRIPGLNYVILSLHLSIMRPLWPALAMVALALVFESVFCAFGAALFAFVDVILVTGYLFLWLANRKVKKEGWCAKIRLVSKSEFFKACLKGECHKVQYMSM
jgi:hypothetical protein